LLKASVMACASVSSTMSSCGAPPCTHTRADSSAGTAPCPSQGRHGTRCVSVQGAARSPLARARGTQRQTCANRGHSAGSHDRQRVPASSECQRVHPTRHAPEGQHRISAVRQCSVHRRACARWPQRVLARVRSVCPGRPRRRAQRQPA
jgi:hypothetical protein